MIGFIGEINLAFRDRLQLLGKSQYKTSLPAILLLLAVLGQHAGAFAHGKHHGRHHSHPSSRSADIPDSLAAFYLQTMRREKGRFLDEFESYRLHYHYQQTADKFRLYHDENGIDRQAFIEDLRRQEFTQQHYIHNLLDQALNEGNRIAYEPGFAGKKLGLLGLHYLVTGNYSRSHLQQAGLLFMRADQKLGKNTLVNAVTRLTPPDISTRPDEIAIDIHVHTIASFDGTSEMETLILKAVDYGLGAIAVTDHDSYEEVYLARRTAGRLKAEGRIPPDFLIVPGQEVSSREGHILALFTSAWIPMGLSARETIAEIHRQDGLAIAPHPLDHQFGLGEHLVKGLPLDGMVVTGATPSQFLRSLLLARDVEHRMAIFMDTDAHSEDAVGWTGHTIIQTSNKSEAGVKEAVRNRRTRPVHRKILAELLEILQRPGINLWYQPIITYHQGKLRVEEWLAALLRADHIDVQTSVERELEGLIDFYRIPEYFRDGPFNKVQRDPFFVQFVLDYGRLRLVLRPGDSMNFRIGYRYAWIPGQPGALRLLP